MMKNSEKVNLLIVEDDIVDFMALERQFIKCGLEQSIHHARSGYEALACLRGADGHPGLVAPYIILLDLKMPQMDGFEFLREIRKDPQLRRSIVFILSASRLRDDYATAYDYNVAGCIMKPRVSKDFQYIVQLLRHYMQIVELN